MARASLPPSFRRIRAAASKQSPTISLGQLLRTTGADHESRVRQALWLREHIPVRFARRLDEFFQLPHVVVSNPHINRVMSTYLETFERVSDFPAIRTDEDEAGFCELIRDQLQKHQTGTELIAEGYREVRQEYPRIRLDEFLDNFFVSRISTRVLLDNYVVMRNPQPGYLGVVRQGMRTIDVVKGLESLLTNLTKNVYGETPEVKYRGNINCELDYIPRHVNFMVRELLKNALRATVERHRNSGGSWGDSLGRRFGGADAARPSRMPPVSVELQKGDVHVIIKISDQGGGMPKAVQRQAWQYGWSTCAEDDEAEEALSTTSSGHSAGDAVAPSGPGRAQSRRQKRELAGYGFGLPLTRLHAQYFGGDVFMQALPGHGTDMYLLLTHLKEGAPSTESDDLASMLTSGENVGRPPLIRNLTSLSDPTEAER
mmetsp:Transcript_57597/g.151591  ORF Transcript_57597/g.151591 Transcript_57597/m.151591 type:complete len:430 (-) Transcript_57597:116-1405(-)